MFKKPFLLKGRITRTEYGLSVILSPILLILIAAVSQGYLYRDFILVFSIIGYFWFNITQATKRCHDVNQSGIMQIIPFYGFVLVFEEGTSGKNHYGEDPKSNQEKKAKTLKSIKTEGKLMDLIQKMLPFALFNVILIVLSIKFLDIDRFVLNISLYLGIILSYILFIIALKRHQHSFELRLFYCSMVFVIVRIYTLFFLNYSLDVFFLILELSFIAVSIALTYVSSLIHQSLTQKKLID